MQLLVFSDILLAPGKKAVAKVSKLIQVQDHISSSSSSVQEHRQYENSAVFQGSFVNVFLAMLEREKDVVGVEGCWADKGRDCTTSLNQSKHTLTLSLTVLSHSLSLCSLLHPSLFV